MSKLPNKISEVEPRREISAAEKTLIILSSVDQAVAQRLLAQFSVEEIGAVANQANEIGALAPVKISEVLNEFLREYQAGGLTIRVENTKALIQSAIPEGRARGEDAKKGDQKIGIWENIEKVPVKQLVAYLRNENKNIVARIASNLPNSLSSQLLAELSVPDRAGLLQAMMTIEPARPIEMAAIEAALSNEFRQYLDDGGESQRAVHVAEFINDMPSSEISEVMECLTSMAPDVAEKLAEFIFKFEDMVSLPKNQLARVLDQVQQDVLAVALQGSAAHFKETVLSVLPARARRLVESEIDSGADRAPIEIHKARTIICKLALATIKSA